MYCPTCATTPLVVTQRQSVEIDYCPQCRGVWLDRGELDKILERAGHGSDHDVPREAQIVMTGRNRSDWRRPKHRKSWLSEILD